VATAVGSDLSGLETPGAIVAGEEFTPPAPPAPPPPKEAEIDASNPRARSEFPAAGPQRYRVWDKGGLHHSGTFYPPGSSVVLHHADASSLGPVVSPLVEES
jgi:hypothetical protein